MFNSQHPVNLFQCFWKLNPVKAICMYCESSTAFMWEIFPKFSESFKSFSPDSHNNQIVNPHHNSLDPTHFRNVNFLQFWQHLHRWYQNTRLLKLVWHLLSSLSSYSLNTRFSALMLQISYISTTFLTLTTITIHLKHKYKIKEVNKVP